jgi:ABC-type multidrug transport system ATPase subunit
MILQASHIAKAFGSKQVLKDVSFSMEKGSLIGIVGENGSGKSTLLNILVGRYAADQGEIQLKGKIGFCPQKPLIFPQLTVDEHFQYFAAAYQLAGEEWEISREKLLEQFHFEKYRKQRVATLSGGTQQKLNLSLALLHEPEILILDEPYNGFDWETYQRFWAYSSALKEKGHAILVVTHLVTDTHLFDHIFHLNEGKLI